MTTGDEQDYGELKRPQVRTETKSASIGGRCLLHISCLVCLETVASVLQSSTGVGVAVQRWRLLLKPVYPGSGLQRTLHFARIGDTPRSHSCRVVFSDPSGSRLARYKAGRPKARPQSLANKTAVESSSQAGEVLLQFPPVSRLVWPVEESRNQICTGPFWEDS